MEIQKGSPSEPGMYVAYTRIDVSWRWAAKTLLMWDGQRWGYPSSDQNFRGAVFGWIGPLPALKIEGVDSQ